MADQAPFPHFLPPSEHRLTTQASCRMLPQKPGTESACRNAREPLEHELPSDLVPPIATAQNKTERLWAERRTILPPSRTQGYAARDTYCFHHKKRAPASLEPVCFLWSGWRDLNARPQRPERCALAKLSHIPLQERTLHRRPAVCKLFFQKNFSPPCQVVSVPARRSPGHGGTCFAHIGQLGFDFMKKGAKTHIPVRLPGKNFFEVALCRTQVPRTILATARS